MQRWISPSSLCEESEIGERYNVMKRKKNGNIPAGFGSLCETGYFSKVHPQKRGNIQTINSSTLGATSQSAPSFPSVPLLILHKRIPHARSLRPVSVFSICSELLWSAMTSRMYATA
jgi:hypothetical protein